jgi:hypothetical protein
MATSFEQSVRFFQQDGRLPENVFISLLADREFANLDVQTIANMTPVELAVYLKRNALEHYPDHEALDIARAILQRLADDCGVKPGAIPVTSPQEMKVKVELPERLEDLGLSKLFMVAATDSDRRSEALALIKRHPDVVKASKKTPNFVVLVAGKLDVSLTVEYIGLLNKQHSTAQRQYKGNYTSALDAAFGTRERPIVHPKTGEPIEGPDEAGFDYSLISEELHLALIWARVTKHAFWPTEMDLFTFGEQVTAETLSRRWQTILNDYRHAKASGDSLAEGLTRYWSEEIQQLAGILSDLLTGGKNQPQQSFYQEGVTRNPSGNRRSEQEWKQLVMSNVVFPAININGSGRKDYQELTIPGGQVNGSGKVFFNGTFLVGNLTLNGSANAYGLVKIAHGYQINCNGSASDNTTTQYVSWETIAVAMGLA